MAAVALSTAAVITAVVATPLIYFYVAGLQSQIMADTEFCQVSKGSNVKNIAKNLFSPDRETFGIR